jgi:hypothetical protein
MEKESLAEANARFIEYHVTMTDELRMVDRFERVLLKLKCIKGDTRLIYLDWDDHMKWAWGSYKKRVKDEQEKTNRKTDA